MASCNCGTSSSDAPMRIVSGATYRRSVTYTEKDGAGNQVILDAADYYAELVIRRGYDAPVLLELSSVDDPNELSLSTDSGSIVILIDLGADITAVLPIGKGYVYTLRLIETADPAHAIVVLNDTASVKPTAFSDES